MLRAVHSNKEIKDEIVSFDELSDLNMAICVSLRDLIIDMQKERTI